MKATICDSVALTTDLHAFVIEAKEEPSPRDLALLALIVATTAIRGSVCDEQVLELP